MLESIRKTLSVKPYLIGSILLDENQMAQVEIYTWRLCPFCIRAKGLLDKKGIIYQEHQIDGDPEARNEMSQRADGRRTVPQIFINNKGIGGCDELHQLERQNQLDLLLNSPN